MWHFRERQDKAEISWIEATKNEQVERRRIRAIKKEEARIADTFEDCQCGAPKCKPGWCTLDESGLCTRCQHTAYQCPQTNNDNNNNTMNNDLATMYDIYLIFCFFFVFFLKILCFFNIMLLNIEFFCYFLLFFC